MKNYGFIPDKIDIGKDYQFGGYGNLGGTILQPSGQWLDYLPQGETQRNYNFDSMGCVSWGTLNALEILLNRMYGVTENFSDRYLAKVSLTTPTGNSPQKVSEALRKFGTPKEKAWPITPDLINWELFYSEPTPETHTAAKKFLDLFTVNHEYVPTNPSSLKSALKYSPVGAAVSAWATNDKGLYVSTFPNNHWTTLVGYVDGEYWIVYDSYTAFDGEFIKKLAWDYNFGQAKRYAINIKDQNAKDVWYVLALYNLTQFFAGWWRAFYGVWQK